MRRRGRLSRQGVTLVEGALVFLVFLTLVLGAIDLGTGVFHYHLLAGAARQGARQAIVHGKLASALGSWGPTTVGPVAGTDFHLLVQAIQPYLVGFDLQTVQVLVEWPDGGNSRGQRVRVTVTAPYQPALPFLLGDAPLTLQGSSLMPIAH